jgi:hypothetical protein
VEYKAVKLLAEAPFFRLSSRKGRFSLVQIREMLSPDLPLYFSPYQKCINWLSGQFKHDFIVLPEPCYLVYGMDNFYDQLFSSIFGGDIVNLDRIEDEDSKALVAELVSRKIVDESLLSPVCKVVPSARLNEKESLALKEITRTLEIPDVKKVILDSLMIDEKPIGVMFFEILGDGVVGIPAGLFNNDGLPLDCSNLQQGDEQAPAIPDEDSIILVGLRRDHPFIRFMVENINAPNAVMYILAYVAHELVHAQSILKVNSKLFYLMAERLGADMRRALMKQMIPG